MSKRDSAGETIAIILAIAGTIWVAYWNFKIFVTALLHPLRTLERSLPIVGILLVIGLLARFGKARDAKRSPVERKARQKEYARGILLPIMRGKTTKELLEIVTQDDRTQWTEDAVHAARQALKERPLTEMIDGVAEFRAGA